MKQASVKNENSGIIEISGFDEFMYECYKNISGNNQIINERWKDYSNSWLPIKFTSPRADYFIKLNTFESISIPMPLVFDTDITSWKELKEIVGTGVINSSAF
jgi:hypothetical protein